MSALPKWASLRTRVTDDARLANGQAHLESPEVPQWVAELGDHDLTGALTEALGDCEGKRREKLNALVIELCLHGEDLPVRKAMELLDMMGAILTDHCVGEAQRMYDREHP